MKTYLSLRCPEAGLELRRGHSAMHGLSVHAGRDIQEVGVVKPCLRNPPPHGSRRQQPALRSYACLPVQVGQHAIECILVFRKQLAHRIRLNPTALLE